MPSGAVGAERRPDVRPCNSCLCRSGLISPKCLARCSPTCVFRQGTPGRIIAVASIAHAMVKGERPGPSSPSPTTPQRQANCRRPWTDPVGPNIQSSTPCRPPSGRSELPDAHVLSLAQVRGRPLLHGAGVGHDSSEGDPLAPGYALLASSTSRLARPAGRHTLLSCVVLIKHNYPCWFSPLHRPVIKPPQRAATPTRSWPTSCS